MIIAIILLSLALAALIVSNAYFAKRAIDAEQDLNSIIAGLAGENAELHGQNEIYEQLVEAQQERIDQLSIYTGKRVLN